MPNESRQLVFCKSLRAVVRGKLRPEAVWYVWGPHLENMSELIEASLLHKMWNTWLSRPRDVCGERSGNNLGSYATSGICCVSKDYPGQYLESFTVARSAWRKRLPKH
jgi:hypothetical protein